MSINSYFSNTVVVQALCTCALLCRACGCGSLCLYYVCVPPCLLPIPPSSSHPHIHSHLHLHIHNYTHTHRHIHIQTTTTSQLSHGKGQEEHPHEGKKAQSLPPPFPCTHTHTHIPNSPSSPTLTYLPHTHAQRLKGLLVMGYAYARPVAYYGMIPFILYVGMNGDAAPNWSDLPRYLLAVL